MKKFFTILLVLFTVISNATAQSKETVKETTTKNKVFHLRFNVGINATKCSLGTIENYEQVVWSDIENLFHYQHALPISFVGVGGYQIPNVENYYCPGISVGVVGEFRISDHFGFQVNPSINFGSQKIVYDVVIFDENGLPLVNENGVDISRHTMEERSLKNDNWLELSLLMKYSIHGFERAYLIGGITPRLSMNRTNLRGGYYHFDPTKNRLFVEPFDLAFEIGIGINIYKEIGIQFKWSHGLMDMLEKYGNFYDLPLKSMKSNQFQIGIVL